MEIVNLNQESSLQKNDFEQIFKEEIEKYKYTINYKPKYGYEFFRRMIDILFFFSCINSSYNFDYYIFNYYKN